MSDEIVEGKSELITGPVNASATSVASLIKCRKV